MNELPEKELDTHFAAGFMLEWVKDSPEQVKSQLEEIIDGVDYYREKHRVVSEDYDILNKRYNDLVALSAVYLNTIQELRGQTEQLLIETQRDLHRTEE